jgi:hypothetical protein
MILKRNRVWDRNTSFFTEILNILLPLMKKTLNRIVWIFAILWVDLLIRWIITGQQNLITIWCINIILSCMLLIVQFRDSIPHVPHLHKYRKQYWRTTLVFIIMRYLLRSLLLGWWLEQVLILLTLLWAISFTLHELPRLHRWRQWLSLRTFLWWVSLMIVVLIFQKYRAIDTPRLIVTAMWTWWLVYALGMTIAHKRTLRDPLLITRWLLTVVAWLRAATTVLILSYEDRTIEVIVYEEKEIYLPAEQCLPDWGSISLVQE